MQLQAGYIIEALPSLFAGSQRDYVESLVKSLSYFDLETNDKLEKKNKDSFAVVIYNLILRGLPTLAPTFIEDIISTTFLKTKKQVKDNGSFSYSFVNDELKEEIFRALHIIDPRISIEDLKKIYTFEDDPEADLKKKFLFLTIPSHIGEYFLQLIDVDRSFVSILKNYSLKSYYQAKRKNLLDQTLDFVVEVPYAEEEQYRGLAVEIEKKLIEGREILDIDEKSWLLSQIGWGEILYLKQSDFYSNKIDYSSLVNFSYNQYFEEIRKNYERPLYGNAYGMDGLQIALSPFEVARIQRVILEYILAGKLDLNDKNWKIAVIERDVPGAFLAIQDLSMKFNNLYHLAGVKKTFPQVDLEIFYNEEFESAALNILYQGNKFLIEEFDPNKEYDLVIDSSVLRYKGLDINKIETKAKHLAIVRSDRYLNSDRRFLSALPINYQPFILDKDMAKEEIERRDHIKESFFYFVKNIFRRQSLASSQIKALSSVLSGNNTLVDFPFAYEKTLLYQIVALLRPGHTLVIEPLVTALLNQVDKLKQFRIDAVSYMCLNYYDIYKCLYQKEKITNLSSLFVFITGEIFHINDFRTILKVFIKQQGRFSLVVIDQAQSVSPWSHTFNFAYYTVGENIKKLLPDSDNIVILALSSGLDYDAKEDVISSLNIGEDSIYSQASELSNVNINLYSLEEKQIVPEEKLIKQDIEKAKSDYLLHNNLLSNHSLVYTHFPNLYYDYLTDKIDYDLTVFSDYPVSGVSSLSIGRSLNAYDKFRQFVENEKGILIANSNISIGIDKANVRALNMTAYPLGVADMLYLLQSIGREDQPAEANFVFSNIKVFSQQKKYIISSRELTAVNQTKEVSYEQYAAEKILSYYQGNLKKDFTLAQELLENVKFTKDTPQTLLIRRIFQLFGIIVSFEAQPAEDPTSLYVYDEEELLGIINLKENIIDNQASALKKDLSDKVLVFVDNEIRTIVSSPLDFLLIMDEYIDQPHENILSRLVNMSEGDIASVIIDFTNDLYEEFTELLGKKDIPKIEFESLLWEPINYDRFIEYISGYVDKKFIKKNKEKIENIFFRLRTFIDTYRLIYFLIVIGVVDDYLIDYRNQHFVIKLKKLSDDQYLNRIYKRILAFVSKDKALQVFQKIPGFKGDGFVHKVLNYWIYFEYEYIIQRKYDSIHDLGHLISSLYNNGDTDHCKYIIANYLKAKYIFDLEDKKKSVKKDWIKIIDYFIKKIGIFKSNLRHLYETAQILLDKDKSDYIALLMRGWAGLLINEDDNSKIAKALDDIAMALNIWRQNEDVSAEDFIERIDALLITLENYNFELKTKIEKLFHLKIFTSWLRDFNKQFIDLT